MTIQELFDKTLFLLGAGASVEAGCKPSKEMLTDLKIKINQFDDQDKKQRYNDIYDFIIACLKFKFHLENQRRDYDPNIEDFVMVLRQLIHRDFIIPRPLIGSWNEQLLKWEIKEESIFKNFLSLIRKCLVEEWVIIDKKKTKNLLKPIHELMNDPELKNIDIFTLNYDLVFERGLNTEHAIAVNNGFIREVWSGFSSTKPDPVNSNDENDDSLDDAKIKYFKLHGSIDWHYDKEFEIVRSLKDDAIDYNDETKPLIIFGTDTKMVSIDPFLALLSNFRDMLRTKKFYVVIGYSFFDQYLNNLIIQQLQLDPKKKMLVVDPCFRQSGKKSKTMPTCEDKFINKILGVQNIKGQNIVNLSKISKEKIIVEPLCTGDFYRKYLSKGATKLKEYYQKINDESQLF